MNGLQRAYIRCIYTVYMHVCYIDYSMDTVYIQAPPPRPFIDYRCKTNFYIVSNTFFLFLTILCDFYVFFLTFQYQHYYSIGASPGAPVALCKPLPNELKCSHLIYEYFAKFEGERTEQEIVSKVSFCLWFDIDVALSSKRRQRLWGGFYCWKILISPHIPCIYSVHIHFTYARMLYIICSLRSICRRRCPTGGTIDVCVCVCVCVWEGGAKDLFLGGRGQNTHHHNLVRTSYLIGGETSISELQPPEILRRRGSGGPSMGCFAGKGGQKRCLGGKADPPLFFFFMRDLDSPQDPGSNEYT